LNDVPSVVERQFGLFDDRVAGDGQSIGGGTKSRTESLADRAKRWSAAVKDRAVGPLVVAQEIVDVVDGWERYKAEADGMSATQWLKIIFGKHHGMGPAYWRRRASAVVALGEASRRTIHHEVAVWVTHKLSGADLLKARAALIAGSRTNGRLPLNPASAKPIIRDMFGWERRVTKCNRCEQLEGLLRANGIDVPEE